MEPFDPEKYEEEKRERRRLRARQNGLRREFLRHVITLSEGQWEHFASRFEESLEDDIRLEEYWIDTDRYLIAIYNLFRGLGFRLYSGPLPRVSGVQPDYHFPLLAYDSSRAILIENNPTYLFVDLADVQPRSPLPLIGLSYNSIVTSPRQSSSDYPLESLRKSKRLAGALALGHLTISTETLKDAISLNPFKQTEELKQLANRIGLGDFLRPPIDTLPVFGQHVSANHDLTYNAKQFLEDARRTSSTGSQLSPGDVTQAGADEALADPDYFLKELQKARLIGEGAHGGLSSTARGTAYLRSRVLPFPLGLLLYHTCLAAREEVQQAAKVAFLESIQQAKIQESADLAPLFVAIDDIDSFAKVNFFPANSIQPKVPLQSSEAETKELIQRILADPFVKTDWGGEQNDIYSSRVLRNGKRLLAAFFLKGPSVRGRLTIAKCGKNGDQIQRLFQLPADMFVIQFNGAIDERVMEECRQKVKLLRVTQNKGAFFTTIDGIDTARLMAAYDPGQSSAA